MTYHARRRIGWITVALGVLLGLLFIQTAQAELSRQEVEAAVAKAQRLAKGGAWSEADELLERHLPNCRAGAAGLNCRPLISYTRAYLREQQARRDPERREQLLGEASDWYQRVLDDVPGHGTTLNNLALINRYFGNFDRAVQLLEQAMNTNPDERSIHAVTLGDLFLDRERWDDALRTYERAMERKPSSSVAPSRIVETYRHLPAARLSSLADRLPSWESSYPEAAAQGYRLLIERAVSDGAQETAERALLAWASLLARQRRLTSERVADLYQVWPDAPLTELRDYMGKVEFLPDWWRVTPKRRQAITEVALALGHADLERGHADLEQGHADLERDGPRAAKKRWSWALREFAPGSEWYFGELQGYRLARLELQTELAALYHQYPNLEEEQEFQRLIWSIFKGKGDAYAADDLVAIQRHHTVLGTIYAQDSRHESSNHPALNAVFQLHYAIRAANRRFEEGDAYQPLPRLKEMLAAACERPSPVVQQKALNYCRTSNGESAVAQLYLDAAEAYLDTDEFDRTSKMIKKTASLGHTSDTARTLRRVNQVLAARKAIERATDEDILGSAAFWLLSEDYRWIAEEPQGGIFEDFAKRQRFKALSDYAAKVAQYADTFPTAAARLEETKPLLSAAANGLVLAGTADELRVESLAALDIRYTSFLECLLPGSQDIWWVQRALKKLTDPGLEVDGNYGPLTKQAVRAFQAKNGLSVDGLAGDETKSRLHQFVCG